MSDFIEVRVACLEDQVKQLSSLVEELRLTVSPTPKGIPRREAAVLLGMSPATLSLRLKEAVRFPEKSALKEGFHFQRRGNRWKILNLAETQKAIAENDRIFGRLKKIKGEL